MTAPKLQPGQASELGLLRQHHAYVKRGIYGEWAGCLVQVPRLPGRLFSFAHYATEEDCLRDALIYRDWCIEQRGGWSQMPKTAGGGKSIYFKRLVPLKNNRLGILGVHEDLRDYRRRSGHRRRVWRIVAQLLLPRSLGSPFPGKSMGGRLLRADFNVYELGYGRALELARDARRDMERLRDRLVSKGDGERRRSKAMQHTQEKGAQRHGKRSR